MTTATKTKTLTTAGFDWTQRTDEGITLQGRLEMSKDLNALYYAASEVFAEIRVEAGTQRAGIGPFDHQLEPTITFICDRTISDEQLMGIVDEWLNLVANYDKRGVECHVFIESLDLVASYDGDRMGHPLSNNRD